MVVNCIDCTLSIHVRKVVDLFDSVPFKLILAGSIGFAVANALYDIFMAYESPAAGSNFGIRFVILTFCICDSWTVF
jgi:hypothetical protein